MYFSWTLGLSLGALYGCPQWGSVAQMWAAEASPECWLRVGPVPSSNLELPGGCKAAFSVPFSFPLICLALQGSAPQRYLSSSFLGISRNDVPTQEIDSRHLLWIQAWDFESLVYHVLMMTGLKRHYCEEMFWWPEIAEISLCSVGLEKGGSCHTQWITIVPILPAEIWLLSGWTSVERVAFQVLQLHTELLQCWVLSPSLCTSRVSAVTSTCSPSLWSATDFG